MLWHFWYFIFRFSFLRIQSIQGWRSCGVNMVLKYTLLTFFFSSYLWLEFKLGKIQCNLNVYIFCDYQKEDVCFVFLKNGHDMQFALNSIGLIKVVILGHNWLLQFWIFANTLSWKYVANHKFPSVSLIIDHHWYSLYASRVIWNMWNYVVFLVYIFVLLLLRKGLGRHLNKKPL